MNGQDMNRIVVEGGAVVTADGLGSRIGTEDPLAAVGEPAWAWPWSRS